MKYAIIRLGGKQFKVSENDTIQVERQQSPLNIDVLAYGDDDSVEVGAPVLTAINVDAEIIDETKVKTTIGRYKSKSRYRKIKGHKQPFSIVKISKISSKKETTKKEEVTK